MHLIVILILLAVIVYLLTRPATRASLPVVEAPAEPLGADVQTVAFLSRGKIFLQTPGGSLREVHSPHVQTLVDRQERSRALHAWKADTAFSTSFAGRRQQQPDGEAPLQARALCFLDPDRLLYVLGDGRVSGIFVQTLSSGAEQRLVHRQGLQIEDFVPNADRSRLLCSQRAANGAANIAVMNLDGSEFRELTGGDTVDTAPTWLPDQPDQLVYQTAGIARAPHGGMLAIGPSALQLLDTRKSELTPVLESAEDDHLQPRVGSDGALYFIRRPHERASYGSRNLILDTLAFPFRVLRALFHYLNFFSLMYTRKPLTSASGPLVEEDLKSWVIKGKRLDAEAALRQGVTVEGIPSLVPRSWQLVRRDRHGAEQVLAQCVACFDFGDDGSLYWSNGYGVFRRTPRGRTQVVLRDAMISELSVAPRT